jgi:flagellin-like hook-associated protein FlgL
MERLSSGTRINRAKDDAAGLSVADNMTAFPLAETPIFLTSL